MSKPGSIFKDYWIQCAICEFMMTLTASTYPVALANAKEDGWRYQAGRGWVCADCRKPKEA